MTRRLALVRHSVPIVDERIPARQWQLADEGRIRCQVAADDLRNLSAHRIFTSHEPKAIQTAEEIGRILDIPVEIANGVHEHQRPRLPFYGHSEWHQMIADLFANPDSLVFGLETANQARTRFTDAIVNLTSSTANDDLIVVTHGTVMSLYLAQQLGEDGFTIWKSLEMPDVRIVPLDATE